MSTKPLPKVMAWDKGFWESARKGVLSAQQCEQCQSLQLYPRTVCLKCFSRNLSWKALSGKGKVHAF
ncbi:MAG: zinc ribbon domain-containing protein, partial [Acidobacteriota bacterium]